MPLDLGETVLDSGTSISAEALPDLRTIAPVARYAISLSVIRSRLDSDAAEFAPLLEEAALTRIAGFADAWGVGHFSQPAELIEAACLLGALFDWQEIDTSAVMSLYRWNSGVRASRTLNDLDNLTDLFLAAWHGLPKKLLFNLLTGQIAIGATRMPAPRGHYAAGRVIEATQLPLNEIPPHLRGLPRRGFPFPKTQVRRVLPERGSQSSGYWIYHTNAVSPHDQRTRLGVATLGGDVVILSERLKDAVAAEGFSSGSGVASELQKEYARLKEAVAAFETIHAQIVGLTQALQRPLERFAYHARLSAFTQAVLFKYLELAATAAFHAIQQRGWNAREVFEGFSFRIQNGYLALTDQFLEGGELLGIIALRGYSLSVYHFQS